MERSWTRVHTELLPGFDGQPVEVNVGGAADGLPSAIQEAVHGQGPQPIDEAFGKEGKLWSVDPNLDKGAWQRSAFKDAA